MRRTFLTWVCFDMTWSVTGIEPDLGERNYTTSSSNLYLYPRWSIFRDINRSRHVDGLRPQRGPGPIKNIFEKKKFLEFIKK